MEHLNRIAKTAVDGLGANKTEKAIDRVGKTVGTLTETLEMFDKENHVGEESGAHTNKSSVKDMSKILEELLKMDVFKKEPGRKHNSFQNLKPNLIKTLDEGQLNEWMYQHSTKHYYTHIHVYTYLYVYVAFYSFVASLMQSLIQRSSAFVSFGILLLCINLKDGVTILTMT